MSAAGATDAAQSIDDAVPPTDAALVADATVEVQNLSVWFGPKVALTELTCSFGPGVTGLLGPNGAGKTTLMRSVVGLVPPNLGHVRVAGRDPRADRSVHALMAMVPEDEAVPEQLTARQFVEYVAALHAVTDRHRVAGALAQVDLTPVADRRLSGFSKGMRQRAKVAAALTTDPQVLVLDEPLNGADPVQRASLIELFHDLGDAGRTVVVSSHVLHEVERMAERVIVILQGRLAAAGGRRAIRDAMADRPQRMLVRTPKARRLAAGLLKLEQVAAVSVEGDTVTIATNRWRDLALALPIVARRIEARLLEVRPLDDSLESLFKELVR
jgi:ABC-2 type transport system ATP-binding protein